MFCSLSVSFIILIFIVFMKNAKNEFGKYLAILLCLSCPYVYIGLVSCSCLATNIMTADNGTLSVVYSWPAYRQAFILIICVTCEIWGRVHRTNLATG